MQSKNKIGSAFLMVLGAVSVLAIITFSILHINTNRSFSTRFMSNEKKAEAIAESATDLMLAYVKKNMNDISAPANGAQFYNLFRIPAKLVKKNLYNTSGGNEKIDVNDIPSIPTMHEGFEALRPMKPMIDELGHDNVHISIDCKIVNAEAFCDNKEYEVVGITERAHKAIGDSAKIYDSILTPSAKNDGALFNADWAPSQWGLTYKLPSLNNFDSKVIKVDVPIFGDIDVTVILKRVSDTVVKYSICGEKTGVDPNAPVGSDPVTEKVEKEGTIDLAKAVKDFFSDKITDLSMTGIRQLAMPDSDSAVASIRYCATKLKSLIDARYSELKNRMNFGGVDRVAPDDFDANTKVVEKGCILEIKTVVNFTPNGPKGVNIEKRLIAQIPAKVSDVQPVAPEYTFFVANADKIAEGAMDSGVSLGGQITLSSAAGKMIVHNVPDGNYASLTGLDGGNSGGQVPGMLRINSDDVMVVNSFLGTQSEPEQTELDIVTSPTKKSPAVHAPSALGTDGPTYTSKSGTQVTMKNTPVWQWYGDSQDAEHYIDFPVLFDVDPGMSPIQPTGLKGVLEFFKQSQMEMCKTPTLLFGISHLEYPLGIKMEAPLDMYYAHAIINVDPKASFPPAKDETEIWVNYKKIRIPYGIVNNPCYTSDDEWSPQKWNNMPANCYSLMQYAKKATYFYESGSEFLGDSERISDGMFDINGVTYIKGDLTISSAMKFTGKGLIVVNGDINLNANITRDTDCVVSLIARSGRIYFNSGCSEVHAACFSNNAPHVAGTTKIYGNLICNNFDREEILNLEIFYDSKACRTSPLSVMRDVGKFDPSRYYVSMSENWSKFEYAKKE